MPTFADLLTTITARLSNEEDFAFPKQKEGLALTIRSDYLPRIQGLWSARYMRISIDDDGDIAINSDKGYMYLTKDALILSTAFATIGTVSRTLEQISPVLDELFKSRRPLKATTFATRLFVRLRFTDSSVIQTLQPHYFFTCMTTGAAPHLQAGNLRKLRWQATYGDVRFRDEFQVEIEPSDFEIWYNREGKAEDFSSFEKFATQLEASTITERLRPIVDPLIADPTRIRPPAFLAAGSAWLGS